MERPRNLSEQLASTLSDEAFTKSLKKVESFVAKVLSVAMVVVLIVSIVDLCIVLISQLFTEPYGFFNTTLIEIFGLFLNVLVALEILENITAYLKKHEIQVELVIATSLTAVARKIIIFDFEKAGALDLAALALAVVALSAGYWVIRRVNRRLRSE
ncbi:phosphate-starvation-inducible PsiE family protein [Oscillatoria sp. FACHB-1407]|uniref:phosphate-starvation-inducible PsiE family protein n=1 Tax=Oscillatoria sp. FACHB-1407 TaxID=2692847 RepID=UPI0016838472|nr:phosphate-starvation-inducible PsiE family protein [Oscillatoria sp. FACHB-1407]MBD2464863.1 phosphate-starvation-inducible PsiE family protein [Oscillatoria sp. FACHB-1407]